MRIATAQFNQRLGDFDTTLVAIQNLVSEAKAAGVQLLVLHELATTAYPPRDMLHRAGFVESNLDLLAKVAALSTDKFAVVLGYVRPNTGPGKPYFNSAALCVGGRVRDSIDKSLLPTYRIFEDARYFEAAKETQPVSLFGHNIGFTICEDLWNDSSLGGRLDYARDPIQEVCDGGAEILINLSASPFELDKPAKRLQLLQRRARHLKRYFVYTNELGCHDEIVFDGQSLIIAPDGSIVARAKQFDEDLLVYDIPEHHFSQGGKSIPEDIQVGRIEPEAPSQAHMAVEALVFGVRDYVHKNGFKKAIIGLSGGIDSAVTAALATRALGAENVRGVAMPSRYSSEHSLTDAKQLADNLNISYDVINIEPVFQALLTQLSPQFEGLEEDVTEENMQSRVRGNLLMALSNKTGALVLTTGNKSELAVGYCTMYGDMCGALAVISDVYKTQVFEIARALNSHKATIPLNTINKAPSAELRPGQIDEDSLPPYAVLDQILRAYVEDNASISQITALGIDEETVRMMVRLIDRNEYKRWQSAPGLCMSPRAFGRGRRIPLSASFPDPE